ncbi:ABC transporter ATP-binding protein [uncultured Acetatifactor sp.]|jgi:ABC-type multidrug transport system fused ATPase/permease subunit|uniref:ABC transporter ATP-binding protein n=1 Tax=uncultured Acetatifactor sp. TaxID=1671927 RepID=UPI002620DE83|nr:ABC transporter ATP-binding protein [uncultured Acetatifactor sp.]
MEKWRELGRAFGYVPKLFGMVYRTDRRYLFYLICETLSFAALAYPGMFLVKYAFDAMEGRQPFGEFAAVCILLLLLQLAVKLIKSFFNSIRPGRTSLVVGKLYNAFHRKSMELDYQLLAEKEIQELQVLAGDFIRYRLANTVWNFVALFSSLMAFLVACILLIHIDIRLIAVVVGGMLLDAFLSAKFVRFRFRLDNRIIKNQRHVRYFDEIATSDKCAKDLRIFDLGGKMKDRAAAYMKENLGLELRKKRYTDLQGGIGAVLSYGIDFAIYGILGYYVLQGALSMGSFSLAIGNIALFREYFGKISDTLVGYSDTAKYMEYYNRFMALESRFRKTGRERVRISADDSFDIAFRDVSFRYPGQAEFALEHMSFTVHSREKISIVGENGAGKSTLVKLLMRLYDPTEGEILVNGIDIRQYDYEEYLSMFAPVFQDYKLFAFTVGENISSFWNENQEKVEEAARKSGIHGKIMQLPGKYETFLTKQFDEEGVEFSGGEQQKIALARTYCKTRALITILDEPTSALDPRAEYAVYQEFNDLIGERTAFFISHRLASAKFCDKILVIKDKRVSEYGSHAELMQRDGYYHMLYDMQASYYQ